MKKTSRLFLVAYFYLAWFGSVALAKGEFSGVSYLFPSAAFLFLLFSGAINRQFVFFSVPAASVGILFDSTMAYFGLISVVGQSNWLIPAWLVAIWFQFVISMPFVAKDFSLNPIVFALAGAVMGPLSYESGRLFDVLTLNGSFAWFSYSAFWAIFLPSYMWATRRAT